MNAEKDAPEFLPFQLKQLADLADKVAEVVEWHGARLVVEVWDRADSQPVAWVDVYPEDSHPAVTFTRPLPPAVTDGDGAA